MPYKTITPEIRERIRASRRARRALNREKDNAYNREWRCKNLERALARERADHFKRKEKRNKESKDYYAKNKRRILDLCVKWQKENAVVYGAYRRQYEAERKARDPLYRLHNNLRVRLNRAMKRGSRAGSAVRDLGCSITEFKAYIEAKFLPGMSWENWGRSGWHLDHIKPLTAFDLTDLGHFREAMHYTNYQPLWHGENIRKGGVRRLRAA